MWRRGANARPPSLHDLGILSSAQRVGRVGVDIDALRHYPALLGTITRSSHPFADELKAQPDTLLYKLPEANREEIAALVEAQLRAGIGRLSV